MNLPHGSLLVALCFYVYASVLRSPEDGYLVRKGTLQTVRITKQWTAGTDSYAETTLVSDSGLEVQLLLRKPQVASRVLPVAVLLGGVRYGGTGSAGYPSVAGARRSRAHQSDSAQHEERGGIILL